MCCTNNEQPGSRKRAKQDFEYHYINSLFPFFYDHFSFVMETNLYLGGSMRPKARGLARHGSPSGYLEESDPAVVILYMMDGRAAFFFLSIPAALTGAGPAVS